MDYTQERALPAPRDPWAEYERLAAASDRVMEERENVEVGSPEYWRLFWEHSDLFHARVAAFQRAYLECYGRTL